MKREDWASNEPTPVRFFGKEGQDVVNKQTGEEWELRHIHPDGWIISRGGSFKFATFGELAKDWTQPKDN
jgi:hypothetical protein